MNSWRGTESLKTLSKCGSVIRVRKENSADDDTDKETDGKKEEDTDIRVRLN